MIKIINKANTINVEFHEYSDKFLASKICIEKGAGNRVILGPNMGYIHILYAYSNSVVEITTPENYAFDSGGGVPFTTMESLYEKLAFYMEDREGAA